MSVDPASETGCIFGRGLRDALSACNESDAEGTSTNCQQAAHTYAGEEAIAQGSTRFSS